MATVNLNTGAVRRELNRLAEETARKGALSAQQKVKRNISTLPRVDTGLMRERIGVRQESPTRWRVHSGTFYTLYQEEGTRAHGAVTAKALRFKPKGSNSYVFAKWVRGVTPGHFFRNTPGQMTISDFF